MLAGRFGRYLAIALIVASMAVHGSATTATPSGDLPHLGDDVAECEWDPSFESASRLSCDTPPPPRSLPVARSIQELIARSGGHRALEAFGSLDPASVVDLDRTRASATTERNDDRIASSARGTPGIPCTGNGRSGRRIQAVYAYGATDRSKEVVPLIRQWAAHVDATYRVSAARQGGRLHLRWATTTNCVLTVIKVRISAKARSGFNAWVNELARKGLDRSDRKYLVWTDASTYCGISTHIDDDRPTSKNRNNGGRHGPASWSRIDRPCWDDSNWLYPVAAHELAHALGAVQSSAPHATGDGHCWDAYEVLCYEDDSGDHPVRCDDVNLDGRWLDCRADDYFSLSPKKGTYIARHWNIARSGFVTRSVKGDPVLYRAITLGAVADGPDDQTAVVTLRLSVAADDPLASASVEMRTDVHDWEPVEITGGTARLPQVTVPRDDFYVFRAAVSDRAGRTSSWRDTEVWCYISPATRSGGVGPADNPSC